MTTNGEKVELAVALTVAWLGNAHTRPAAADDVPAFLRAMVTAIDGLSGSTADKGVEEAAPTFIPAVSARKSLADPEFILSMIDGKPYRSLKRHLSSRGLTPTQYRERYSLPATYPMVAPGYARVRSEAAKRIGLGMKPRAKVEAAEPVPVAPSTAKKLKGGAKSVGEAKAAAKAHLGG